MHSLTRQKSGYSVKNRHVSEFFRIFTTLDQNKDGFLDVHDLTTLLTLIGETVSEDDVRSLVASFNAAVRQPSKNENEEDDRIDFSLFFNWIAKIQRSVPLEHSLSGIFQVLDKNKDGYISANDLVNVVQKLGIPLDAKETETLIMGNVDFSQFCTLISKALPTN